MIEGRTENASLEDAKKNKAMDMAKEMEMEMELERGEIIVE